MSNDHVSNLMKGHMESLAAEGKRADGRGINEFKRAKNEITDEISSDSEVKEDESK